MANVTFGQYMQHLVTERKLQRDRRDRVELLLAMCGVILAIIVITVWIGTGRQNTDIMARLEPLKQYQLVKRLERVQHNPAQPVPFPTSVDNYQRGMPGLGTS